MRRLLWLVVLLLAVALGACAQGRRRTVDAAPAPTEPRGAITKTIEVDGVERKALVYPPANADDSTAPPAPVIFAFHGFHGTAEGMTGCNFQTEWPDAVVVYPQGLPISGTVLTVSDFGWVPDPDATTNRDVRFTDSLLWSLMRDYRVDPRRVYATGMSDGGLFTYVLLTVRPQMFAAFAPVASANACVWLATVPRPILIIHGKNDDVIYAEWAERTRDLCLRLNGCGTQTTEWAPGYEAYYGPSTSGMPVIWHLHDGGHEWPGDATAHIVRFFQQYELPED